MNGQEEVREEDLACGNCYDTCLRSTGRVYACARCGQPSRECYLCRNRSETRGSPPIETCAACSLEGEDLLTSTILGAAHDLRRRRPDVQLEDVLKSIAVAVDWMRDGWPEMMAEEEER